MHIFKEIPVKWAGENETVKLTFEIIDKIESDGVNIAVLANNMQKAAPPFSSVSKVYYHLLKAAGITADKGEIYQALYGQGDGTQPDIDDIMTSVVEVISAAFPPIMDVEKPKAAKKKTSHK